MDLNITLTAWQKEFLETKQTVKALSGSSDSGKSFICRLHQIYNCLAYSSSYHFATANTYRQSMRAIAEPMIEFLEDNKIEYLAHLKKGEGFIEFFNRSRIEIFSADNLYHRIRSREFSSAFIEEASTISDVYIEKSYYECIRRLRQPNKCPKHLLIATNPDLKTRWLYKNLFNKQDENVYTKQISFKDGFNANDKEREDKILMGTPREIDLFYHGLWSSIEGQAYTLQHGRHIVDEIPTDMKYFITFDYGFSDAMVYLLIGVKSGCIYVVDEIVLKSTPVNRHTGYLQKWFDRYNISGFTGETATGAGEIRDLLLSIRILYLPTVKTRTIGWTKLADLFDRERLKINIMCKNTINSLSSLVWANGTKGVDVIGEDDHCADALRYAVMSSLCPKKDGDLKENIKNITISNRNK